LQNYGSLPLSFEINQGQTHPSVQFAAHGGGYNLFLTANSAILTLRRPDTSAGHGPPASETRDVVGLQLVGANPLAQAVGQQQLVTKTNYLLGNDPRQWRTNIPNYGRVFYQGVYPGVDEVYYGNNQGLLETDFVVAPGTDPSVIRVAAQAVTGLRLSPEGDLMLGTGGGDVVQNAPVIYQDVNGVRRGVTGRYVLQGGNTFAFQVGAYDRTRPLVIDPVLVYSTYLGGSLEDVAYGIGVDGAGNAYVAGHTYSTDFPTANPLQSTMSRSPYGTAFVSKLSADGTALLYSTYLGGSGRHDPDHGDSADYASSIAVDNAGDAYVTGYTTSTDFPTAHALQSSNPEYNPGIYWTQPTVFLSKLSADGRSLTYSTYLGGTGASLGGEAGNGIAIDSYGNAYITGYTYSSNFPTANALQTSNAAFRAGLGNAFVSKLSWDGTALGLTYSTYLGGSGGGVLGDAGDGIAVDSSSGSAYVTGFAGSRDFPLASPLQSSNRGLDGDAFVSKLSADGRALTYSTFLGGSGYTNRGDVLGDTGYGIALGNSGEAYVTGYTFSSDFPTANALQSSNPKSSDQLPYSPTAFVSKLSWDGPGARLLYVPRRLRE
jgi:hypothetical protein